MSVQADNQQTRQTSDPGAGRPGIGAAVGALIHAPRRYQLALAAVFAGGLVLRFWLVSVAQPTLVSDARDYHELAQSLVAGRGYVQLYHGETQAFEGFTFRAFRAPGYPLVMAGVYALAGVKPALVLLVQVLADVVTQVCAVLIAVHLLGRGSALIVLMLLALHVAWTPSLTSESVFTAWFALLLLAVVFRLPERGVGGALTTGLIFAAALLTRPIALCVLPVIGWRSLRPRLTGRAVALLMLMLLPAAGAVGVWGYRNTQLFGRPVLLTTNFGHHNAWDYGGHADQLFAHLREKGLNEAEINATLVGLEVQVMLERPGAVFLMWARRGAQLFSLAPAWETQAVLWQHTFDTGPTGSLAGRVFRVLHAQYYITYVAAAAGALLVLWRRRSLNGLLGVAACYVVLHALVSRGDMRLAAPLYPILCICAASLWVLVRGAGRSAPAG